MTTLVIAVGQDSPRKAPSEQHIQISVNIHAEVLDSEVARRKANVWLLENAGNLLGAEKPELLLGDRLFWRYDVVLGAPNLERPGTGSLHRVGQIVLDAVTGEIQNADTLARELQAHAATVTG